MTFLEFMTQGDAWAASITVTAAVVVAYLIANRA